MKSRFRDFSVQEYQLYSYTTSYESSRKAAFTAPTAASMPFTPDLCLSIQFEDQEPGILTWIFTAALRSSSRCVSLSSFSFVSHMRVK